MAATAIPPTRAEWVDAQLRRAILDGELKPNEKLRAEHLAERWGVSPTPLRETFMRLAGEGLVVIEPQRGARVAPIDVEQAVEIYELRLLLDPAALDRSMAVGDPGLADDVVAAQAALGRAHSSRAEYLAAHRHFHLVMVSRCPNRRLVREVERLLDQSQRFQTISALTLPRRQLDLEHGELGRAVAEGDRRGAGRILRAHLRTTLDAVRSWSPA